MEFKYSESLNGILKRLYLNDNNYFQTKIKINYSSIYDDSTIYPSAPLDFSDSRYWVGDILKYNDHYFSFCFIKSSVKITGYEMKTSNGTNKPVRWYFSASNDGVNWMFKTEQSHNYQANEVKHFEWNKGTFKCFRIDCIQSAMSQYSGFDIYKLELYGTYYPKANRYTCNRRKTMPIDTFLLSLVNLLLMS